MSKTFQLVVPDFTDLFSLATVQVVADINESLGLGVTTREIREHYMDLSYELEDGHADTMYEYIGERDWANLLRNTGLSIMDGLDILKDLSDITPPPFTGDVLEVVDDMVVLTTHE